MNKATIKIIIGLCLFLCCRVLFAAPVFNEIIFFGDSLTDNGNFYAVTLYHYPKSPPYGGNLSQYKGRFTNGPVWADTVSEYYYSTYHINSINYAYGGASALPNASSKYNLESEIQAYYKLHFFKINNKALYVIWIGSNDYLYAKSRTANSDEFTSKVVNQIASEINWLIRKGAKYFLVLNLSDLSQTPYALSDHDLSTLLSSDTLMHNDKLKMALQNINNTHPGVSAIFLDIYSNYKELTDHTDIFNQEYNTAIDPAFKGQACYSGGWFTMPKPSFVTKANINMQLQDIVTKSNDITTKKMNIPEMTDLILNSPELNQVFTNELVMPCANPDQYIFWDSIHPTTAIHQAIASIAIGVIAPLTLK